jgi:hypothetical protein
MRAVAGFWVVALILGLFLAAASGRWHLYGVCAAHWQMSSNRAATSVTVSLSASTAGTVSCRCSATDNSLMNREVIQQPK